MKRSGLCVMLLFSMIILTACSVTKTDTDKIKDVDFTVMDPQDLPERMKTKIEAVKKEPFRLTYGDEGYLYIARGYGEKDTSGYSVEVSKCYETAKGIRIKSSLLGPAKGEKIHKKHTCPYVVIKLEYSDKDVVFD